MTTTIKGKPSVLPVEALLGQDRDVFKQLLRESLQEVLEAEMTELLGAECGQRGEARSGDRAGYHGRSEATLPEVMSGPGFPGERQPPAP